MTIRVNLAWSPLQCEAHVRWHLRMPPLKTKAKAHASKKATTIVWPVVPQSWVPSFGLHLDLHKDLTLIMFVSIGAPHVTNLPPTFPEGIIIFYYVWKYSKNYS